MKLLYSRDVSFANDSIFFNGTRKFSGFIWRPCSQITQSTAAMIDQQLKYRLARLIFTLLSRNEISSCSRIFRRQPIGRELFRSVSRNNNRECQQTLLCKFRRMRQNCLFRNSGHCSEIEKFGCVLHNFSSRPGKRPEASRGMLDPKRPPSSPASV